MPKDFRPHFKALRAKGLSWQDILKLSIFQFKMECSDFEIGVAVGPEVLLQKEHDIIVDTFDAIKDRYGLSVAQLVNSSDDFLIMAAREHTGRPDVQIRQIKAMLARYICEPDDIISKPLSMDEYAKLVVHDQIETARLADVAAGRTAGSQS